MVSHDSIAFTGMFFKTRSIQDDDLPPAVFDETIALESFCGEADTGPSVAQHVPQVFLGERKSSRFEAVRAEE
jgi:hypothetical protein